MSEKWIFPHGKDLTRSGHNNTAVETFLDNPADSLTREVIQNSLDAHNEKSNKPVEVSFSDFFISKDEIPGISQIENEALPKAKDMWQRIGNKDTQEYLENISEVLASDKIKVMKISDYNTKGLNKANYDSLIAGNAYSVKDDDNSAGSKGIGKAAPFAASDLRMVFYNTLATDGIERAAGIMNFVSFYYDEAENEVTQERLSYIDKNNKFHGIDNQITFKEQKRTHDEYGTDLFIIGLTEVEEWGLRILFSTVNNFLVSIYQNKLKINVCGNSVDSKTLGEVIDFLDKKAKSRWSKTKEMKFFLKQTKKFYDVLTNSETKVFYLPEKYVAKYEFINDVKDAELHILQHEEGTRSVLETRNAGMTISERKGMSSDIQFSGLFQAVGLEINAFLKDLENAKHDVWSPERKKGEAQKIADKLLLDLFRWYRDTVQESFGQEGAYRIDAFGVKDLLPLHKKDDSEQQGEEGLHKKFAAASMKKVSTRSSIIDGDKEEDELDEIMKRTGIDSGSERGSSGPGSNGDGAGGGDNPNPQGGTGKEKGSNVLDDDSVKTVVQPSERKVAKAGTLTTKIIAVDPCAGKYRLIGKVLKPNKVLEVNLKSIGANGSSYSVGIESAHSFNQQLDISATSKVIKINKAKKDQILDIDFKITENLQLKMDGVIYEIKG
ncbi:MAG: hypothetical protein QM613_06600 [Micrococcaceae bacterium]